MSDDVKKDDSVLTQDFVDTPTGKVYDKGEGLVKKMNRKADFDKDLFFQELYENYLVVSMRSDLRQKPSSRVITRWDLHTSFDDFLSDALEHIESQLNSIKLAKIARPKKMRIIDDSILSHSKFKPAEGSEEVGKRFGQEDYEVVEELLKRSREAIQAMRRGEITFIVDQKTGRVRVGGPEQK